MAYVPVEGSEGRRFPFQIIIQSLGVGTLKAAEAWSDWVKQRQANHKPWVDVLIQEGLRCVSTAEGESTVVVALILSGHASPLHPFFKDLQEPGALREVIDDLAATLIDHVHQSRIDMATAALVWSVEVL